MTRFLALLILISLPIKAMSQETRKVLFLGNSYTSYFNMPNMVSEMAISTGDALIYDTNTPGGARFVNHANNTNTQNKINAENWDFVTLQAQSQETSFSSGWMETELYPFATQLADAIRNNYSCSQPLFYMTWGRENGDSTNCNILPWVCTYEGMDDAIRNTYVFMAEQNNSEIAPVGAVWRYLRTNHPEIDLYANDGSHPSRAGSYAAACAFYTMIFKKDPTLITWNSTLSEIVTNTIKQASKTIVFDSINDWDYTAYFEFTIDNTTVEFTNNYGGDIVNWDFGDGSSSSQTSPTHTYTTSGEYVVTLTINSCGRTHMVSKTISLENLDLNEFMLKDLKIYPNPVKNTFHIDGINDESWKFRLFTVLGQEVKTWEQLDVNKISVSNLNSGIYLLTISDGNRFKTFKIIKE